MGHKAASMIDIPQPYLIVVFGALFGATVTALVRKIAKDQETVEQASEIVNTNATLERAVKALQVCNDGLEDELRTLKDQFEIAQLKAADDLAKALGRIDELERIIRTMDTVREIKGRRVARANVDVQP
jgi:hypothetical protein